MAKNKNKDGDALARARASAKSSKDALARKAKEQVARAKAAAKSETMGQRIAAAGGVGIGGVLSGSLVGEINRVDPGGKIVDGEYRPGYARVISYVVGAAGAVGAGLSSSPVGTAVAITAGQMIGQQRAIDVFQKGLTRFSKGVEVQVDRPVKN